MIVGVWVIRASDVMGWLVALLLYLCECHCLAFECSTSPLSKEVQEFTICASSNQTNLSYNEAAFGNECQYMHNPPIEPCPSALCWRALGTNGSVEVALPLLPHRCRYTSYEATLMVLETSDPNCYAHNLDLMKIHTRKRACVVECLNSSCSDRCNERGLLTFHHVFSACYQLILIPYEHQQPHQSRKLESAVSYFDTGHNKTAIQTDPLFITIPNPASLSLKTTFPTIPTLARFKLMQDVDKSVDPEACRKTGTCVATCDTVLGSRHIQCSSDDKNSNVSCGYQSEDVVSCMFSQLKTGNYCVRLTYDDDRCERSTIWDNNDYNYSMCVWQTDIFEILPAGIKPKSENRQLNNGHISLLLLTLLILIILVTCGVTWWILHHRINNPSHKFTPILTTTPLVPERNRILLLYARDCPDFLESVTQLRTLLKRACACEVMDCWEDSQYQSVAKGPVPWLMSLLTDSKVRTILVTSPASALLESGLVNGFQVSYLQPKAFDCVIVRALNHLHETYSHDSYKSLFIVRLDSSVECMTQQMRTYLNPLTTYELPIHLNALLANLQNMNPTECKLPDDLESDVRCLKFAITEYRRYLGERPHYLDSLMATDST